MKIYFKLISYLIVIIGVSSSIAGSYDDFFRAIGTDDETVVAGLLRRGFDPNTPNPQGEHPLFLAIREPAPKVLRLLLAQPRLQVDARNAHDETPLMMAALKGQVEAARGLLERDADPNKPGWTPLHYAATSGHVEIIRLLLAHDAYIDAGSPNGSTPLMMAAMYGTPAAVKVLLEAGADPLAKNDLGLSALDFAQRAQRRDSAALIQAFAAGARSSQELKREPTEPDGGTQETETPSRAWMRFLP